MTKRVWDVDDLLSSRYHMDDFIHELCHVNLDNCSGSAYREVRLCRYDRGMLLLSQHHRDCYCHIAVATNPEAKIRRGCQDSRYNGDASPSVSDGELVSVWSNGNWTKDGPWVPKIREWLSELIEKLNTAKEQKLKREEDERLERIAAQKEKEKQLVNAWR